jgi:hypothetical protein
MANFNFGIDCPDRDTAEHLMKHIEGVDLYQDGLDFDEERVAVISKTGMLDVLKTYASAHSKEISIEVWPEDMEYDDAEESGEMEYHTY